MIGAMLSKFCSTSRYVPFVFTTLPSRPTLLPRSPAVALPLPLSEPMSDDGGTDNTSDGIGNVSTVAFAVGVEFMRISCESP